MSTTGIGSLKLLAAAGLMSATGCASSPSASSVDASASPDIAATCCAVVELRQYTLHPGQRDVLIDLFEREFIEGQEAVGIHVIGQFRDVDDPDRFIWLRGFDDMPARATALQAFYHGPVWQAHRGTANPTMIDSDNVLLLRPARATSGFAAPAALRPPRGATNVPDGLVVANLYYFDAPASAEFVEFFDTKVARAATQAGASILAAFATEVAVNNYPSLPVREGENVFVWFSRFDDGASLERFRNALADSPRWRETSERLRRRLIREPEVLTLAPTARSQLP